MPGLVIHSGNRLELLVRQLADDIRPPQSTVLASEIIITQSHGMARWVAMQLALRQRISANLDFPFPNAFLNLLCEKLSLDAPGPDDPFSQSHMTFLIMKKLPGCLSKPGYESLRSYFSDDHRQLKLLQLSKQIAHLFDQYLVFRPDLVRGWDRGESPSSGSHAWQADLWREITSGREHLHRVSLHNRLMAQLKKNLQRDDLPERISVFGISYLPAFHLQILSSLSRRIPVNWYFLSPCREYWGDVVSSHAVSRIRETYADDRSVHTDLHLDSGNPLLASMGTMGRDFINMIADYGSDLHEHYVTPDRRTLLSCIQADILDMLDATDPEAGAAGNTVHRRHLQANADENSIEIHVCHSAMREIEVLHDNLLDMFQRIPGLEPRDILVMTPDIDTYAPLVQAVFANSTAGHAAIPFTLADRSGLDQNPTAEAFLALIELADSRMESDKVTALLAFSAIRRQFNLDEQDVAVIDRWIRELNIRWGVDASDRKKRDLPFFIENTWKSGLDRLLLGYAMSGQEQGLFAGLLPYDDVEGDLGRVLGNFLDFFSCVLNSVQTLAAPKTLQAWSTDLLNIVDCMFPTGDDWDKEIRSVQQLLLGLENVQQVAGYDAEVELEAVVYHLKRELEIDTSGSGFLSGYVTFCAMLPMRSIPFKVICLIGMNGDAFPRADRALGFDLMDSRPRRGDRSTRDDDKYLFLEALLSARQKLYISHVGRDIQDNASIAPSVLVSELLDYAASGYGFSDKDLVCQHPLQAFSANYFAGDARLFSYSRDNFTAAVAAQETPVKKRKSPSAPLPEPPESFKQLEPETLGFFYANPLRYFLQKRLGIYLERDESLLKVNENFRLGGLDGFEVGQETFRAGCRGDQTEALESIFKAKGMLPPGRVGDHDFAENALAAKDLAARTQKWTTGREPVSVTLDIEIGDFNIYGPLPDIYGQTAVFARFAKSNPRDLVRCWLTHLQFCAWTGPRGIECRSVYLARDATGVFSPPDNSRKILENLMHQYWRSLSTPLPFYPRSSYAYAHARLHQDRSRTAALQAAETAMQGNPHIPGEIHEPYLDFHCDGDARLDETFERVSLEIFEPLFKSYASTQFKPSLQLKNNKDL